MLELTTGDTAPVLSGVCSNRDPASGVTTVADLTSATVTVHVRRSDGTVLTKAATLVDAAEGSWTTSWAADDLSTDGTYKAEAEVTFSNGKIQTFGPVRFKVKQQIA